MITTRLDDDGWQELRRKNNERNRQSEQRPR